MVRAAVDLHMHSCLSPCGDEEMTPNNIVNMSILKELDIIAVTDHNSCKNLPAVFNLAKDTGLLVLPGMEACSSEEVHVLCYFRTLDEAMAFDAAVYPHLPPIPNRPDFFGPQWIMDEEDEVVGEESLLLVQGLDLPLDELVSLCVRMGGIAVPAHINRSANSLLYNLGFIPPGLEIAAVEVAGPPTPPPSCDLAGLRTLRSSDAHRLGDILERDFFIEDMESMSIRSLFKLLNRGDV